MQITIFDGVVILHIVGGINEMRQDFWSTSTDAFKGSKSLERAEVQAKGKSQA